MVLAKPARMKPRDIADKLVAQARGRSAHRQGRGRGPGLHQSDASRRRLAPAGRGILAAGAGYGRVDDRRRGTASTSSTSRPIRPGRCTSAIAAAPCSAMRSPTCWPSPATTVTREYYINDAGGQVDTLARSAFLRYREALGETIGEIPAGALSRRLPEAGRRGAGARAWRAAARQAGGRLAAAGARHRDRRACWR